ncbi:MarR family transcriptional regulator [Streptomyces sp. DSM 44917]|uniref:MarR family transcriptional regulator n=1 Tax=Streptomyces boetiae TaxID=3075541 RepID=A0ABU2LEW5_9ACTN|nr:MarR family transcriptional regulator [Streptomyces sp. DSM 44917]MDT0310128.1 MarR family transcriptional regulator [Streptomyces sp. DSM 44917]
MDNAPDRLAGRPTWLLGQLAGRVRHLVTEGFAAAGARGYHYRLLAALAQFGPQSQAQLGARCRVDPSDVVAAVGELADHGYATRTPDPANRRRNRVAITEAGAAHLRLLDGVLDTAQDAFLAPLTPDERRQLTDLLTRLLAHHSPGSPGTAPEPPR